MRKKIVAFFVLLLIAQILYWLFVPLMALLFWAFGGIFGYENAFFSLLENVFSDYYDLDDTLQALVFGPIAGFILLIVGLLLKKFGKSEDSKSMAKYIYVSGLVILSIYGLWFITQH